MRKPAAASLIAFFILLELALAQTTGTLQRPPVERPVTHTVSGTIRKPMGEPIEEQVRVVLRSFTGGIIQEVFTNSIGNYEFRNISNGNYIINVKVEGYMEVNLNIEVFSKIPTTFRHDIFLERDRTTDVERRPPIFEGESQNTVSVQQLNQKIPKKALKEYDKAVKESSAGRTEEAIKHLAKAIEIYPDFYQALNNLGAQYLKLGRYAEAIPHFQRAVQINPHAAFPYMNLGYAYNQKGEYEDAVENLKKAIQIDDKSPICHYQLGLAYYQLGRMEEAERSFRRAHDLDPKRMAETRLHLANVYIKQGRYEKVVEELEVFLKENPQSPMAPQVTSLLEKLKASLKQN